MQQALIIALIAAAVAYLCWRAWHEVRTVARYGRCHGCKLAAQCRRQRAGGCKNAFDYAKVHPNH